jgi:carbamoyltransferase
MSITLGLNAAFHDSAAVLVIDGVPVAAAEEERFTRIKHAKRPLPFTAWELPFHAIDFCLAEAGLLLDDVDHVAYSFDPARFAAGRTELQPVGDALALPLVPSQEKVANAWDSPWDPLFLAYMHNAPLQLADGVPHHLRRRLARGRRAPRWHWHCVDHHLSHQASAFLAAPFDRCAVLTLDGRGEQATTTFGRWRDGVYRTLGEVRMPHSLGMLYEQVTAHLGFLHSSDEYKVMALAAMGSPDFGEALARHVHLPGDGTFTIDPVDLTALAGPARTPGTPLTQTHFDLAASLQQVLERKVLALAGWLREESGEAQLAMAGGVALNCVMNARLRDEGPFESVWIQPAAGDAGTALGAALWCDLVQRGPAVPSGAPPTLATRRWTMQHAYLGPGFDDAAIEPLLRWAGLDYERFETDEGLVAATAALLADDRIVGWFQGRMEWGPRALGARSILASPIHPRMQQRLNLLKDREDFRPVAPAVPAERFAHWFTPVGAQHPGSPYMLFTYQVLPHRATQIPSACHDDGSARVQAVDAQTNPRFHALLEAFGARTGVPVLVNTSFNVRGEPIVCTPKDALDAFFTTPLDALAIGRFLLRKPRRPEEALL